MDYIPYSAWTRKEIQGILFFADLSVSATVNIGFIQLIVLNHCHQPTKKQISIFYD